MATVRHGVWLLTGAKPLSDARYWRENADGFSLPTPFSRAIGIRICDYGLSFSGVYVERGCRCQSVPILLRGLFGRSLVSAQTLVTREALSRHLRTATGFAVIAAPGLRFRTAPGLARLVATAQVTLQRADE
jgi:hypothetical protein